MEKECLPRSPESENRVRSNSLEPQERRIIGLEEDFKSNVQSDQIKSPAESSGCVNQSTPHPDCLPSIEYSKQFASSLSRGELWLLPSEAEFVLSYIKSEGLDTSWSFKEIENVVHPPLSVSRSQSKNSKRNRKKKTLKTQVKTSKRQTESHIPSSNDRSPTTLRSSQASSHNTSNRNDSTVSSAQRCSKFSQSQLKKLPDWAQRFHRTLSWLCQMETCRPFVEEVQVTDPRFPEIYDAIQPGLTPIGLSTIVSKLEQNAYQSSLDVFNDIYSVWLCAYRTYTPGSTLWLQTYQASRRFLQQIANQPLKDDFTPNKAPYTPHSMESNRFQTEGKDYFQSTLDAQDQDSASVDQILQQFLTYCDTGDQSQTVSHHGTAPRKRSGSHHSTHYRHSDSNVKRKKNKRYKAHDSETITEYERTSFQNHLSQLSASQHRILFEAFRRTAVWKSIESGEVELDDTQTTPPVFRKMIAWCHAQLENKLPGQKNQKRGSYNTGILNCNHSLSTPHMTSSSSSSSLSSSDFPYDDDDDQTGTKDQNFLASQDVM